jgi:phosphate transport system substrate-binding protein
MKKGIAAVLVFLTSCFVVISCGDASNDKQPYDTPKQGRINISVDETFKPVIEEQIKVYESSFPDTKINASYKSEADCFKDLQSDSTRMIIVARGLKDDEVKFFNRKLGYDAGWDILAYDAVAVIVNKSANDTEFTWEQLSSYLNGKSVERPVVLDGKNATSTVRYVMDSLLKGAPFGKNVMAAKSSDEVIDFVAKNERAIGLVGFSWIGDEYNTQQQEYLKKVQLAYIECKICGDSSYVRPAQVTIGKGQYPLYRPMFYILKENATGLGTGFRNFMNNERGQLIFRRAFLVPGKMGFNTRKTNISEEKK